MEKAAEEAIARGVSLIRPIVAATMRLLVAMAIAYVFVVVLMTASAQSLVIAKLKDRDYSDAYAQLVASVAADGSYAARDAAARRAETRAYTLAQHSEDAGQDFTALVSPLAALVGRADIQRECGIAVGSSVTTENITGMLAMLERCDVVGLDRPEVVRGEVGDVLAGRATLVKAAHDRRQAAAEADRAARDAVSARTEAKQLSEIQAGGKELRAPFAPILILRERAMLGGGVFVQFPPTMMQIVMAFFSGTFGALLLTLVLVVYPNSEMTLTRPEGNYGERILLGGLIAVCVYIVLGGGTAVLGSDNAFADGSANFQAFSAIGVLAGMFSDRVAQWLSTRAKVFYGDSAPGSPDAPAQDAGRIDPAVRSDAPERSLQKV